MNHLKKKLYLSSQTSAVKHEASLSRTQAKAETQVHPLKLCQAWPMACHGHKPKLKRGAPFKIISSATDGVSHPQAKAETRCALYKCSQTSRAPAVELWTLEIALSANDDKRIIQPDKINTLARGFRGWRAIGGQRQTGEQNRGKGAETGAQGKCVRMNKIPLLTIVNIWKSSKTAFATKNDYLFLQLLSVKLKSNAL